MGRRETIADLSKAGLLDGASATALEGDTALTLVTQGSQGSAVADATGGATVDAEARTAINDLLAELRTQGIITT